MDVVYCIAVLTAGCVVMMLGAAVLAVAMALPVDDLEGAKFFAGLLVVVVISGIGLAIILGSIGFTTVAIQYIFDGRF